MKLFSFPWGNTKHIYRNNPFHICHIFIEAFHLRPYATIGKIFKLGFRKCKLFSNYAARLWTFLDVLPDYCDMVISVISGLLVKEAQGMKKLMFHNGNKCAARPNGNNLSTWKEFSYIRETPARHVIFINLLKLNERALCAVNPFNRKDLTLLISGCGWSNLHFAVE